MTKITDSKEGAAAAQQPADWQAYVEDFRRAGYEAVDWIAQYLNSVSEMPVLAQTKPGELFDSLPESASFSLPGRSSKAGTSSTASWICPSISLIAASSG